MHVKQNITHAHSSSIHVYGIHKVRQNKPGVYMSIVELSTKSSCILVNAQVNVPNVISTSIRI